MAPQKYASVRYAGQPTSLVPFRDDSGLVAMSYERAVQAEPPIPMIPTRSALRVPSRPASLASRHSFIPSAYSLPPTEQHPALRTVSSPQPRGCHDKKRSCDQSTITSPQPQSVFEEDSSDEDDGRDLFACDKSDAVRHRRLSVNTNILSAIPRSLRTRATSASLYSGERSKKGQSVRNSASSVVSLDSPGLSDSNTATSPTEPATPPPVYQQKFDTLRPSSLSVRSCSTSRKPKRWQKKAKAPIEEEEEEKEPEEEPVVRQMTAIISQSTESLPVVIDTGTRTAPAETPWSFDKPVFPLEAAGDPWEALAEANIGAEPSRVEGEIRCNANINNGGSTNGHFSPIRVSIPSAAGLVDECSMSFSDRGSIEFGGRRHRQQRSVDTCSDSHRRSSRIHDMRAFPLAAPGSTAPKGGGAVASGHEPSDHGASAGARTDVESTQPAVDVPSVPQPPPRIQVTSLDVERESQKVRSLYESGDRLNWEDGGRHLSERLEPAAEAPSVDEDEHDAANERNSLRSRAPGSRGPLGPTTPSQRDSYVRRENELAGGMEDWEDVNSSNIDRYGFITFSRSETPASLLPELKSPRFSPRKQRNVLVRKGPNARNGSLRTNTGPSRKASAQSLNTQATGMSTTSRRTARTAIRQAANLLPQNKNRRLMDQASDMLALQPGLGHISEDSVSKKTTMELKRKEWERAEKWRKMAKVVKQDEGGGMVFDFDVKNPKLIERTWKGIPDRWRSAAWYSFLSASAQAGTTACATDEELISRFQSLQGQSSPDDVQIDIDVPRTINQHIMFRTRYRGGQRLLFRVLHALSLYFPATGYVQGMASLAATLLSYYDEEHCFVMLVRLWQLRGLNRLYQPGFEELMEALKDFETHWLAGKDVAKKLSELSIDPTAYCTRWYLTLFNLSIPFPAQLRVWDVFMLLGESPPAAPDAATATPGKEVSDGVSSRGLEVLHATSAALIDALREVLLDADFENAMRALTSWVPVRDEEKLMAVVRAEWRQHQNKKT